MVNTDPPATKPPKPVKPVKPIKPVKPSKQSTTEAPVDTTPEAALETTPKPPSPLDMCMKSCENVNLGAWAQWKQYITYQCRQNCYQTYRRRLVEKLMRNRADRKWHVGA